jgi:acyl-[acyl-carrier-protein] desaturase
LVPWSRGRDLPPGGPAWEPAPEAPSAAVRSALVVNLLTEDNLPYYFRTLESVLGRDGVWGEWVRRWTAEEGRHSIALRDYLLVTRSVDPVALERARMAHVQGGDAPHFTCPLEVLVYTALQELATRISHLGTAKALGDPAGYELLKRIAADENLHHLYYRDLVTAAIAIDPSRTVVAIDQVVRCFVMPGRGIPGFSDHARAIAQAGIYDLAKFHDQVVAPLVLGSWSVPRLAHLSAAGEEARARLLQHVDRLRRVAERQRERLTPCCDQPATSPRQPHTCTG